MAGQKRKRSRKNEYLARKARKAAKRTLFDLPSEVRNQIFQLVLSSPDSLHIKFVNKRFYRETAGIEAQFNRVTFDGPVLQAAIHHCLRFLRQCGPNKVQWLKNVVITEYPERADEGPYNPSATRGTTPYLKGNMNLILQLLELGAATPHLSIHLRLRSWIIGDLASPDSRDAAVCLEIGIGLELLFRDKDITHIAPHKGGHTLQTYRDKDDNIMGKHASAFKKLRLRASNVRIFPTSGELDENTFRVRALQNWNEGVQDPTLLPPNGVDVWVEYARHWFSEGV